MTPAGLAQQLSTPSERFGGGGPGLRTGPSLPREKTPKNAAVATVVAPNTRRDAFLIGFIAGYQAALGPLTQAGFETQTPNAALHFSLHAIGTISCISGSTNGSTSD
jgi:hypothetical protein